MSYNPFPGNLIPGDPIKKDWGQQVQDNFADHEARITAMGAVVDYQKVINVTVNGNDTTGDGSAGNPFASLQKAIDVAQNANVISTGGIKIQLGDGDYNFTSPVIIGFMQRLSIIGNLTDSTAVKLRFNLSGYTDPDPHEAIYSTGAISINFSQVIIDGFEAYLDDPPARNLYEVISTNKSTLTIGEVGVFNPHYGAIALMGTLWGVLKDKTFYGTSVNTFMSLHYSSSTHAQSTGHVNASAQTAGHGVGVYVRVGSRFDVGNFQSVTLNNFAKDIYVEEDVNDVFSKTNLIAYVAGAGTHTDFFYFDIDDNKMYDLEIEMWAFHASPNAAHYNGLGSYRVNGKDLLIMGSSLSMNNNHYPIATGWTPISSFTRLVNIGGYCDISLVGRRLYFTAYGENDLQCAVTVHEV